MLLLAAAFIVAFVLLLYMVSPLISPKPLKLPGAHVVVSEAPRGEGGRGTRRARKAPRPPARRPFPPRAEERAVGGAPPLGLGAFPAAARGLPRGPPSDVVPAGPAPGSGEREAAPAEVGA